MIQLVYVSSATVPFSECDLVDLLTGSRAKNSKVGVTGLLLFKDGNFMQALEGEEKDVTPLYQKIARDSRHTGILTLLKSTIAVRDFPDWSMGFKDLHAVDLSAHPGYNEFLNVPLTDQSQMDLSKAKRLLATFRSSMR